MSFYGIEPLFMLFPRVTQIGPFLFMVSRVTSVQLFHRKMCPKMCPASVRPMGAAAACPPAASLQA
jgi:hypothetical protein